MTVSLLIDVGNQRIKWCWLDLSDQPAVADLGPMIEQTMSYVDITDRDQIDSLLTENLVHSDTPDRVLVSCVAKHDVVQSLTAFCKDQWQISPQYIKTPSSYKGFQNHYTTPSQLGIDRWLAALAAHKTVDTKANEVLVIVDAGTAVTVDVVHDDAFQGGAILPGLAILVMGLGRDAKSIAIDFAALTLSIADSAHSDHFAAVVARDSASAVTSGVLATAIGGVNYCMNKIRQSTGQPTKVVVTGGDASIFGPLLDDHVKIETNLVITGLALMALDTK